MSDNWLRYVPVDPYFRPSADAAESTRQLVASLLAEAEDVTAEPFDAVQFIDAGSNWQGVFCSACGADAEAWWADAVSALADAGFSSLMTTAPCCGATVSVNELRYPWAAAFGSFVIDAMNPNAVGLPPEQLWAIGRSLGCEVREIAQHI